MSGWCASEADLDHDVSLEVVLKALELQLQDWRKVLKEHSFARILTHRDHDEHQCLNHNISSAQNTVATFS